MDNNQYNNQNTGYSQGNTYNPNPQYNPNNYNPYSYGTQPSPYYNSQPRRPYDPNNEPMTLKDWILTFLLLMIPFVNLILPFVWAFGSNVNKSKKTFFQAYLILTLVSFVFSIIFIILIFTVFAAALEGLPDYYSLTLTYIPVS